jgi:hypothetical protein
MTCLLLTSSFLTHKSLMNSTDHYIIKSTTSTFNSKKIMHMNNALFIDMLMLCDRRDATSQKL